MKLKASAPYIAVLCGTLLLSLNCASARKTPLSAPAETSKSTSAQPEAASAQPLSPTPTANLQGSYTLINPAAATDTITKAIEASVKGMWFEGRARDRLKNTNLPPPPKITISYTATEVTIETPQSGQLQTHSDGRPVKWTSKAKDKYEVSTKWVNGSLERTFKGDDGQRVNTYSISGDGKTLTMHVVGTRESWPRLKQPLKYQLDYKRN